MDDDSPDGRLMGVSDEDARALRDGMKTARERYGMRAEEATTDGEGWWAWLNGTQSGYVLRIDARIAGGLTFGTNVSAAELRADAEAAIDAAVEFITEHGQPLQPAVKAPRGSPP